VALKLVALINLLKAHYVYALLRQTLKSLSAAANNLMCTQWQSKQAWEAELMK